MPALVLGRDGGEKLNIAIVGVGGRGGDNLKSVAGENIVALCDVDDEPLGEAAEGASPGARRTHDFRKMLDELHKEIDAVVVSTPDHTHAVAAVTAAAAGQARLLREAADATRSTRRGCWPRRRPRHKVATQMGNRGTRARTRGGSSS